jgi:hypothetical protein
VPDAVLQYKRCIAQGKRILHFYMRVMFGPVRLGRSKWRNWMDKHESLSHSNWERKYPVAFTASRGSVPSTD